MPSRGTRIRRVRVLHPSEEARQTEHLKSLAVEREQRRVKSEGELRSAARAASQVTANKRRRRVRGSDE